MFGIDRILTKKLIAVDAPKTRVAVILPVYKNDTYEYFRQAFQSIATQTHNSLEVIIPVDGELPRELFSYVSRLDNEKKAAVLWFGRNRGLPFVLNDSITYARKQGFRYIARMDADDISLPDRIKRQLRFMEDNPGIDVVGTAINKINESGHITGSIRFPIDHRGCYDFFKKRTPLCHPSVLFRVSFFDKAGLYPTVTRLGQDVNLWNEGFKNGCRFANLSEPLLNFRTDDSLFERRGGFRRAYDMFKRRLYFIKSLRYGPEAYVFAVMRAIIDISPVSVKKIVYQRFQS